MKHICPFCETGEMSVVEYSEAIRAGRRAVEVDRLRKLVCEYCGEASVPLEMYAHNTRRVDEILASTPAAVSQGLLRRLREVWGVSQRDASRLFGAGASAFGKWESGQARMSDPSALLAQCALNVPGVMEYLARMAKIEVSAHPHAHKPKNGVDYDWAFRKDVEAPEKTVPALRLVKIGATRSPSSSSALPPKPAAWQKEYSFSTIEMRQAA